MPVKWKCTVCGYVHDGETPPERCPKCGSPSEKFERMPEEKAALVQRSRKSNLLHERLMVLMDEVTRVCEEGIADNLDPGCVDVFTKTAAQARVCARMATAEIATHINKGKWG